MIPGMGESRSLVILGELQRLPTIGELPYTLLEITISRI